LCFGKKNPIDKEERRKFFKPQQEEKNSCVYEKLINKVKQGERRGAEKE
jgi:hypothetical protein